MPEVGLAFDNKTSEAALSLCTEFFYNISTAWANITLMINKQYIVLINK